MNTLLQDLRGQSSPRCPLCELERPNRHNKIFKNSKAVSNHLRISHDLTNEEFFRVRNAVRVAEFTDFEQFRGLIR